MNRASDHNALLDRIKFLESELKTYRLLVENSQDLIYRTDLEGRITYITPNVYAFSGYTVEEAIGMNMAQEVYQVPQDREQFLAMLQGKGQVNNFRARLKRKDGSIWWAMTNAHYFHDDAGNLLGIEGITRDISQLVAAEEALAYEAGFHRVIGEIANSFINMPASRMDQGIDRALASIGEFVGADRCHIFMYDRPSGMLTNTYEWCREGITSHIHRLRNVPKEMFDWFVEPLSQLRNVHIPNVADLPPTGRRAKEELETEEIKSILVVPLVSEGRYAGSIGFNFVRQPRTCSENEILLLEMAAATISNILNRRRAEEALRSNEERMKAVFEAIPDPVVVYDTQGLPQFLNPAFTECFGWTLEELKGRRIPFVPDDLKEQTQNHIKALIQSGLPGRFLSRRLTKAGDTLDVMISAAAIKRSDDEFAGMVVNLSDISVQRELEFQLRQAQKMESVGRLAGGVAHDYNNMLGVILGHTELALMKVRGESPIHGDLQQIKKAAQRSADLTRQLLGFARRQTTDPKVLDLNHTITGMLNILKRLIGENIHLAWIPGENLSSVKIDPTQIDQVLANLCINSRDAIDHIGTITITTENAWLDEEGQPTDAGDISGSRYIKLTVSDNGCGMDETVLEKVFEPFFTTKEIGMGTGLGLATVYGIVKQNNGYIDVESQRGQGARFRIYLPATKEAVVTSDAGDAKNIDSGSETLLLVEDEISLLQLAETILKRFGYTVLTAATPGKAIETAKQHQGPIHLLITDVVMPEMNGKTLKSRIEEHRPDIKTLFMSGHTSEVFMDDGQLESDFRFIQKPFSLHAFAGKVREVLDGGPADVKG